MTTEPTGTTNEAQSGDDRERYLAIVDSGWAARAADLRERAERAEAKVARVEALAVKFEHWPSGPSYAVTAKAIRAALTDPAPVDEAAD